MKPSNVVPFTEAQRNCWWLVDFGDREGKGTQGHCKVHFQGDLKNGVTMDRQKLPLKQKDSKYVHTRTTGRNIKKLTITEQNCSVS